MIRARVCDESFQRWGTTLLLCQRRQQALKKEPGGAITGEFHSTAFLQAAITAMAGLPPTLPDKISLGQPDPRNAPSRPSRCWGVCLPAEAGLPPAPVSTLLPYLYAHLADRRTPDLLLLDFPFLIQIPANLGRAEANARTEFQKWNRAAALLLPQPSNAGTTFCCPQHAEQLFGAHQTILILRLTCRKDFGFSSVLAKPIFVMRRCSNTVVKIGEFRWRAAFDRHWDIRFVCSHNTFYVATASR
jgi:hypothetical protein